MSSGPGAGFALARLVGARLLVAAGLLLAASTLVFWALALVPGDAASQVLGADATPQRLAALRQQYGLDEPVWRRYLDWLSGLARGDLGASVTSSRPVIDLVAGPAGRSAALAGVALLAVVVLGLGGGIAAGLQPLGRLDRVISSVSLVLVSVPEFVIASALILVLADGLGWLPSVSLLPSSGQVWDRPELLVLPALTVALLGSASVLRLVRAVVAAHAGSAHVEAAVVDGLPRRSVVGRHLLPGVVGPVAQSAATLVPYLVGGTVVVEQVFSYPGLGQLLVGAVAARDPLVVQGVCLLLAATTVLAYLLADVVGQVSDPRTWAR